MTRHNPSDPPEGGALRQYSRETDLLDKGKRRIVTIGLIVAVLMIGLVLYLFVFAGGPAESPTAELLGRGIQLYGLALEGTYEFVDGEQRYVEPTPERRERHLGDALTLFNRIIADPGSDFDRDTALLYVGMIALQRGEVDKAQELFETVSGSPFEPLAQQASFTLGAVFLERGELPRALEHYRAMAGEDTYIAPAAAIETARILALQGRPDESRAVLEEIIAEGTEENEDGEIVDKHPFVRQARRMLDSGEYLSSLVALIPIEPPFDAEDDDLVDDLDGDVDERDEAEPFEFDLEGLDFDLFAAPPG